MGKIYVGDAGQDLILDTGVNIGTVTDYAINWKDPQGAVGTFVATLYSSYSTLALATGTYLLKRTLVQTDFDIAGTWKLQAWCAAVDGTWFGNTVELEVYNPYK